MKKATFSKWAILAFIGGIIAFVGTFTAVFNMYGNGLVNFDYTYNGTDLLSAPEFTFGKYLPLVIGIFGLILCVFSMASCGKKNTFTQGKTVVAILAGIMLVLVLVYYILVSTGTIVDWDVVAQWEGFDPHRSADQLKDLISCYVPLEGSLQLIGSLIATVGALMGFNDE